MTIDKDTTLTTIGDALKRCGLVIDPYSMIINPPKWEASKEYIHVVLDIGDDGRIEVHVPKVLMIKVPENLEIIASDKKDSGFLTFSFPHIKAFLNFANRLCKYLVFVFRREDYYRTRLWEMVDQAKRVLKSKGYWHKVRFFHTNSSRVFHARIIKGGRNIFVLNTVMGEGPQPYTEITLEGAKETIIDLDALYSIPYRVHGVAGKVTSVDIGGYGGWRFSWNDDQFAMSGTSFVLKNILITR